MNNTTDGFGLPEAYFLQRRLSFCQALPLVGPLVVSPIKLAVSIVQTVSSIALYIFFTLLYMVSFDQTILSLTFKSGGHALMGLVGTTYSIANMLSLGILGLRIEFIG